jgi:hypothetical protein
MVTIKCLPLGVLAGLLLMAAPVRADLIQFQASLSGLAEQPPNSSPGTGWAIVSYEDAAHTLRVQAVFSGLIGNTAAHIHAPTAAPFSGVIGVATQVPSFVGFPLGVTAGAFDNTFDLTNPSSYNPSFLAAQGGTPASAEAAFVNFLLDGRAYFNIHTTAFPGGEIRGFASRVPDASSTAALLGFAFAAMAVFGCRRTLLRTSSVR